LKLAYTFREELTAIFEMNLTVEAGKNRLLKWRDKVRRSVLTCFDTFFTTLDNWLDKIANYFSDRLSSGFVEGMNNKLKTIKRRCYGILRTTTLFQRLYLDLEGYRIFARSTTPRYGLSTQNPKEPVGEKERGRFVYGVRELKTKDPLARDFC
jgi:transposase